MSRAAAIRWWLAALVATITALDVWWRTIEERPPHWDMGGHLADSLIYLRLFKLSDPRNFLAAHLYYPPLVYWVTDAFYKASGDEAMWVAVFSNVVWTALLVFGTYGLGKALWNERVGLVSVAFLVTTPMIVTTLKEYMLDAPLAAIVVVSLYFLVRSDAFASRKHSLLLGFACGAGVLVKWTFPLVLALPVVYSLWRAATIRQGRRGERLRHVVLATLCALLLAEVWYLRNLPTVLHQLTHFGFGPTPVALPPVGSLDSLLWYFWALIDRQLFLLPFVFLAAGIVACARKGDVRARNLYPLLTVIGTYLAFTFVKDKDPRFTLPMIPAVAIIATSWLETLTSRTRRILTAVVLVYGTAAFSSISFGLPVLPDDLQFRLGPSALLGDIPSIGLDGKMSVFRRVPYLVGPPTNQNWHQEDAFRVMERVPPPERRFAYLGRTTIWFNQYGLRYYRLRYDAMWVSPKQARFLLIRGHWNLTALGPLRQLDRWHLPDGEPLTLFEKT
jgi:4-amino-4-deoxy-L-arabinose transferase-like glycosyltransferase